jgi:hypothetical protein
MVKHIDQWFAFARQLELGIENMEEIVLVTGCDRTRSSTNVAFLEPGVRADAQVSFGVKVARDRVDWQFSPEHVQGAVLNQGPGGEVYCYIISNCTTLTALGYSRLLELT